MEDMFGIKIEWIALIATFLLTVAIGPITIKYLQKMKFGQRILEIGPKWHLTKQYTPTMGGFMFIIPMIIVTLALSWEKVITLPQLLPADMRYFMVLGLGLAYGAIGFLDDYTKVKKKQNLGLTAKQKLLLQIAIAVLFIGLCFYGGLDNDLYVPFLGIMIEDIPSFILIPFMAFTIVGAVNAVNLTDGIDGLVTSVTIPVGIFYLVAYMGFHAVSITTASLVGGLLGFLIFNFNPAKVFMGDTGSLFLGGIISALAIQSELLLLLIPLGIIYIIEALSDIIQIVYFKVSGGKRVFKMAPIHHHFEMCGWSEKKIVFIFSGITTIMCIVTYVFA